MRRLLLQATAAAAVVVVAGCFSSSSKPPADPTPSEGQGTVRVSYDPPVRFDPTGVALPGAVGDGKVSMGGMILADLAMTVRGLNGYVTTDAGLQVVDLVTGQTGPLLAPSSTVVPSPGNPSPLAAPVLVQAGSTTLAVAAFVVEQPASGTTPMQRVVEVLALNTATNKQAWTETLELPSWAQDSYASTPAARVLGPATTNSSSDDDTVASDGELVVTVDGGWKQATTWGLTAAQGQQSWQHDGLLQATRVGQVVLGNQASPQDNGVLTALNTADGTPQWQGSVGTSLTGATAVSSTLAGVNVNDYSSGNNTFQVIKVQTGEVVDTIPVGRVGTSWVCHDDGAGTGVCSTTAAATEAAAAAFDGSTGARLWALPQVGSPRVAPTVTTAWHGAVYGATSNGPVVLQAKTGADREVSPGIAPVLVNDTMGIAVDNNSTVSVYTPIG